MNVSVFDALPRTATVAVRNARSKQQRCPPRPRTADGRREKSARASRVCRTASPSEWPPAIHRTAARKPGRRRTPRGLLVEAVAVRHFAQPPPLSDVRVLAFVAFERHRGNGHRSRQATTHTATNATPICGRVTGRGHFDCTTAVGGITIREPISGQRMVRQTPSTRRTGGGHGSRLSRRWTRSTRPTPGSRGSRTPSGRGT